MQSLDRTCNMVHVQVAASSWRAREMECKGGSAPHFRDAVSPGTDGDVSMMTSGAYCDGSHAIGECPDISTGAADVSIGDSDDATTIQSSKQKSESQGVEDCPQASLLSCRASLSMDLSCLESKSLFRAVPSLEPADLLSRRSTGSVEPPGAIQSPRTDHSPLNGTPEGPLSRTPEGPLTPSYAQTPAHPFSALELPPSVPTGSSAVTSPRSARWARRANRAQRGQSPGVVVLGAPPSQGKKAHHSASSIPLLSASPRSGSESASPGPGALPEHSLQEEISPQIGPLSAGCGPLSIGSMARDAHARGEAAAKGSPEDGGFAPGSADCIPATRLSPISASALPSSAPRGRHQALGRSMEGGLDRSHSCERRMEKQDVLLPSTSDRVGPTRQVLVAESLKGGQHLASLAATTKGSPTPVQSGHLTRMRPASPPAVPQNRNLQCILQWKDPSYVAAEKAVEEAEGNGQELGSGAVDKSANGAGAKLGSAGQNQLVPDEHAFPGALKAYLGRHEARARLAEDGIQSPDRQPLRESVVEEVLERLDQRYGSPFKGYNRPSSNDALQRVPSTNSLGPEDGRGDKSARAHLITWGRAKRSITPHGFITPLGVSQVRLEQAKAAEGPSLEKALAAAEDTNFVRRLQKGRDRAELTQRIIEARSKERSRELEDAATLPSGSSAMTNVLGTAVGAPQDEKRGSEPAERRRPKQGDMLRRYILSRQEGQRRILELQSISPDRPRESSNGGESDDPKTGPAACRPQAKKDLHQDGPSLAVPKLGGRTASRTGTGEMSKPDLSRAAMSVLAPLRGEVSVEKSSSEVVQEGAREQKQREAVKALKPHQLCILNRPYKDVQEFYAIHNQKFASGRYGVIRRCKDVKTGKIYACKTIHKKKVLGAEEADGIRAEVAALTMLKGHPSVIKFKGAFEDHQAVHLVMEYCLGGDLFDRVRLKGCLAERDAARLMAALVTALNECHCRGIIHRDIKPENVLLTSTEADYDIKLVDFGVAALFQPGKSLHGIAGTPEYMAPEVLKRRYGPQVDIWSAGVLLYVVLSGLQPFWAASKHGLMTSVLQNEPSFKLPRWAHVSEEAVDLVKRMLDKDPRTRITGEQILVHPWLQKHAKERTSSD